MINTDIKSIYDTIYNDEEIREIYCEVEIVEERNKGWGYHNFEHVKNVTAIVERILRELNFEEDLIYKAKIACLFHDTGANKGKEGHAARSYEYAKDYFKNHNISFNDLDLVLEAIKIHGDGFDTTNVIALALILADKLDIKKSRISEEGKKIEGNRQYSHIEDIVLNISNKMLEINFITDGNMDLDEVNEFYFTKKVFKAIESFANKLELDYSILLDNKEWKLLDFQK